MPRAGGLCALRLRERGGAPRPPPLDDGGRSSAPYQAPLPQPPPSTAGLITQHAPHNQRACALDARPPEAHPLSSVPCPSLPLVISLDRAWAAWAVQEGSRVKREGHCLLTSPDHRTQTSLPGTHARTGSPPTVCGLAWSGSSIARGGCPWCRVRAVSSGSCRCSSACSCHSGSAAATTGACTTLAPRSPPFQAQADPLNELCLHTAGTRAVGPGRR